MADELGVKSTQLCDRDLNILKYCRENGSLDKFTRVVCGMNTRPPKDMYAYFTRFLVEKKHMMVAPHVARKFSDRLMGKVTFFKAMGVVMVLNGRIVACFFQARNKVLNGDQRPVAYQKPLPPVPYRSPIFGAALRSELPSRGRETPHGKFSDRKSGN